MVNREPIFHIPAGCGTKRGAGKFYRGKTINLIVGSGTSGAGRPRASEADGGAGARIRVARAIAPMHHSAAEMENRGMACLKLRIAGFAAALLAAKAAALI